MLCAVYTIYGFTIEATLQYPLHNIKHFDYIYLKFAHTHSVQSVCYTKSEKFLYGFDFSCVKGTYERLYGHALYLEKKKIMNIKFYIG